MYRVSKKSAKGRPYVHIFIPTSYSSSVDADNAFNRGCAIVALTDALESAGCRVKITLTEKYEGGGETHCMRFMVKDYQDRLDIDQLIFTAAHPAFLRRIIFALQERSEFASARLVTQGGYGRPQVLVPDADCPTSNAIRVCFPSLGRTTGTPEDFLAQMVKALPAELQTEIADG